MEDVVDGRFGSGGTVAGDTRGEGHETAGGERSVVMNWMMSLLLSCQVWIVLRYAR